MSVVETRLDFIKLTIVLRGATKSFSRQNNQLKRTSPSLYENVAVCSQYVCNTLLHLCYLLAESIHCNFRFHDGSCFVEACRDSSPVVTI